MLRKKSKRGNGDSVYKIPFEGKMYKEPATANLLQK